MYKNEKGVESMKTSNGNECLRSHRAKFDMAFERNENLL